MAVPGRRIRIAFGALPTSGEPIVTDWVDVTDYCREVFTRSGRSQDLDRQEAATATITLDNTDGRFTPENSASPYYPNVLPFVQVEVARLSDTLAKPFTLGHAQLGVDYATLYTTAPSSNVIFRGLVERWKPTWYTRQGGYVTIEATDLFRFLGKKEISKTYAEQTVGARIAAVLADIVNPFPTEIDPLGVTIAGESISRNVLEYLREIAALDGGTFEARADGKVVFRSRETIRTSTRWGTSQATIGDNASEKRYAGIELSYDEQLLVNRAVGANSAATSITAQQDLDSIASYLERSHDLGTTAIVSITDVEQRAIDKLALYSQPRMRVDDLAFELMDETTDSETLTALQQADRVTVTRRPDQGNPVTGDYHVQGVDHRIGIKTWRLGLHVAAAPPDLFILGYAQLGTTAVLRFSVSQLVLGTGRLGSSVLG